MGLLRHPWGLTTLLIIGTSTHPGKQRETNEDSFCVLTGGAAPAGANAVLAVADGMGGHAAGEVASRLAVLRLAEELTSARVHTTAAWSAEHVAALLEGAVRDANDFVHCAAESQGRRGMGTTLTAVLVAGLSAIVAHVGDSRAYLLRDGELSRLTEDHSWVAEQVATGILTREQAAQHPRRNVITRAIGASREVRVDMAVVELRVGDRLLISTDGVHGVVPEEELRTIVGDNLPQQASDRLIERANELGGPDNSTAIVALVEPPEATTGSAP